MENLIEMDVKSNQIILYRKEDLMQIFKAGKDVVGELIHSAGFPATKINRTYFVEHNNLKKWLDSYAGKEFFLRAKKDKKSNKNKRQ